MDPRVVHMLEFVLNQQHRGSLLPSCYHISESLFQACMELGIDSEVLFVDTYAWNNDAENIMTKPRLFRKWTNQRNLKGFKSRQQMRRIRPKFRGIWNGQKAKGDGYDGHVVVRIEGHLYDATAHQFGRSEFNLITPDLVRIDMDDFKDLSTKKRFNGTMFNPGVKDPANGNSLVEAVSMTSEMRIIKLPKDQGYMLYSIRRGLEKDYFDHGPATRKNIEDLKQDILWYVGEKSDL